MYGIGCQTKMMNASNFSSFNYKLINTDLSFGLIGKP